MSKPKTLNQEQLLRILDQSFDEIFVTDAKGFVVYVNSSCTNHYGQCAEEMVGQSSKEMTEQNFWGPRLSPLVQQYKKRLTMRQLSCTGITMLTTATPVFDKNGDVEFVIENVRNITDGCGLKEEEKQTKEFLNTMAESFEEEKTDEFTIENYIARSKVMRDIIKMSWRIASVNSNVLITGESGTGKSAIARYIHSRSPRKDNPFIEINCAALPESLIESELFGYVRGAFSGAVAKGKPGLIQTAEKGTLFLDEIGELPLSVQAKLLHFIQNATYFEIGGIREKRADCRIIAATNQNLEDMVERGNFRRDLYYRLKVFEIMIPPLTQRHEDVVPLITFYLDKFNHKYKLQQQFSPGCISLLARYNWPGNIRELSNVIEQLVVMTPEGMITEKHLPALIRKTSETENTHPLTIDVDNITLSYGDRFHWAQKRADEVCGEIIRELFKELKSSRKVAAALNISQSTAYRYIQKYCK